MKVSQLMVNRLAYPLGFDLGVVSLSYVVEDTAGIRQKSARVWIAEDEAFSRLVYDSGERSDIDPLDFEPEADWKPSTRYFWKVRVWADNGDQAESETAWFETPKDGGWTGKWISPKTDPKTQVTVYRDIQVDKPVKKARLYGVGLGVYELYLNGEKQGEEYLLPGLHDYDSWLQYQTYELELKQGENRLEFMLGDGWYKGLYSLTLQENNYGDRLACIGDLVIWYEDGAVETIGTDTRWKARKNGIVSCSIYDGEYFDPNMDTSEIFETEELELGYERLQPRLSPRILAHEHLKPIEVIHTPAGETVLDLGQNLVGWLTFTDTQPKGTKLYLQFGEILQNGNFYRDNLRAAKAEFTYISDGTGRQVRPHFTFYGFRYAKITGWVGALDPEQFRGVALYSEMEELGFIETSDPLVNQLFVNAKWGQKGNFLDVPTDCPQRDERMGWTGDAQIFSGTACFNTDVYTFYTKYGRDVYCEQKKLNGSVPYVVPTANYRGDGSTAWGEAATVIPWNSYLYYGKKDILRRQFDSMKAWVEYMREQDDQDGGKRLWKNGSHFGDWLALDGPVKGGVYGATDPAFIASAYYYYSADLVRKTAEVLGDREEADKYRVLASQIKEAFQKEYFTPMGRLSVDTMTAHVVALFMGLVPDAFYDRTCQGLLTQLKNHNYHLCTGFVGTPYLCRVLSNHGMNDLAYHLLLEKGYPGWLYEVLMGATTVWERWNSVLPDGSISGTEMNSLNHYAYGSIVEWMYRDMVGLRPVEETPGFRKAVIAPKPDYRIPWVKGAVKTAAGQYRVEWALQDNVISLSVEIPFNASAKLVLPDADAQSVTITVPAGREPVPAVQAGSSAEMELPAGSYRISYPLTVPYGPRYSVYSLMDDLMANKDTAKILEELFFPVLKDLIEDEKDRKAMDKNALDLGSAYAALPFVKETPALIDLMNTPFIAIPPELQRLLDQKLRSVM